MCTALCCSTVFPNPALPFNIHRAPDHPPPPCAVPCVITHLKTLNPPVALSPGVMHLRTLTCPRPWLSATSGSWDLAQWPWLHWVTRYALRPSAHGALGCGSASRHLAPWLHQRSTAASPGFRSYESQLSPVPTVPVPYDWLLCHCPCCAGCAAVCLRSARPSWPRRQVCPPYPGAAPVCPSPSPSVRASYRQTCTSRSVKQASPACTWLPLPAVTARCH